MCGRGGGFDLPNKGSFGGRFFGFWTIFSVFSGNRKWSRDQGRRTKRPLNSSQIILKKLGNYKVNDRQKIGVDPLFIKNDQKVPRFLRFKNPEKEEESREHRNRIHYPLYVNVLPW